MLPILVQNDLLSEMLLNPCFNFMFFFVSYANNQVFSQTPMRPSISGSVATVEFRTSVDSVSLVSLESKIILFMFRQTNMSLHDLTVIAGRGDPILF